MVSKWSAERVWESTYDLRSEATVQVKKQQNSQLYSAARPSGAKNKKSITWFISPPSGQLPFKSNHHVLILSPNLPLGSFSVKECSMHKHTSPHTRIREVAVFRYSPCNAPQFFLSLKCKERTLQHTLLLPPLLLTEERMRVSVYVVMWWWWWWVWFYYKMKEGERRRERERGIEIQNEKRH